VSKSLDEMPFEELGRLFPIIISEYNANWPKLFEAEKKKIIKAAGKENIFAVHHIGSTSVEGLKAKPTIDMMLVIKDDADLNSFKTNVTNIGYEYSLQKNDPPPHITFYKGYTYTGFNGQAYHLHIRYNEVFDEIVFRDYLRKNESARREYEDLKIQLQKQYEFDREGYTQSKSVFVNDILRRAKND